MTAEDKSVTSTVFGPFDPAAPGVAGGAAEGARRGMFDAILAAPPITIHAPIQAVWDILVGFESYPAWNPLIRFFRLDSEAKPNAWVTFGYTFRSADARGRLPDADRTQREMISVWEPPHCFSYADLGPGYKNERTQFLSAEGPDRTVYHTYERFTGPLSPVIRLLYGRRIREAFARNGLALKRRAERPAGSAD